MARDEVDDEVRWGLVRPAGLVGLIETVVRGFERLFCARSRAQAMAGVASARPPRRRRQRHTRRNAAKAFGEKYVGGDDGPAPAEKIN